MSGSGASRIGESAVRGAGVRSRAAQVIRAGPSESGKDVFCPYYRDMALVLVAGFTAKDVFLGLFGKKDDPSSGGRQMPAHWNSKERNIITQFLTDLDECCTRSGHRYSKLKRKTPWSGPGSARRHVRGDWHGALNFAGIHKLPIVFICENSGAISVHESQQVAGSVHRAGRGLQGHPASSGTATTSSRVLPPPHQGGRGQSEAGKARRFSSSRTYRHFSHTSDDRTYRRQGRVDEWKAKDPSLVSRAISSRSA